MGQVRSAARTWHLRRMQGAKADLMRKAHVIVIVLQPTRAYAALIGRC